LAEPFAETLQPRGEGSFFVRPVCVVLFARVVSHAYRLRKIKTPAIPAALKAARTILTGFWRVKKPAPPDKRLKSGGNDRNYEPKNR
jgi:hypothetical protein